MSKSEYLEEEICSHYGLPKNIYTLLANIKKQAILHSNILMLKYVLGIKHIDDGVTFQSGFSVIGNRDNVKIGSNVSLNNLHINAGYSNKGIVSIGSHSFFGRNCMLLARSHEYNKTGIARIRTFTESIIDIQEGVWVASGAIIIGGVKIGKNAVVAAGAVVTSDVKANTIVGGVPAKFIRNI